MLDFLKAIWTRIRGQILCAECKKVIPNHECARNWGICDECWERIYEKE